MPTYITLVNYTQRGIENVEESPARLDDAKQLIESMGGEFKEWYLTFGEFDAVAITEAPDAETVAKALLTIGKQGSVRTETFQAFPEADYRDIVADLP